MTILMAIQREIVKAHGANEAIVHQQIAWIIEHQSVYPPKGGRYRKGWWTGTTRELAALTGLSRDQAWRAGVKLVEVGLLKKSQFWKSQGDQTCSYQPVDPSDLAVRDSAISGDRDSANSRDRDSANCSDVSDLQENDPPLTPPEEGTESRSLFDDHPDAQGIDTRAERKRAATRSSGSNDMIGVWFELWWDASGRSGPKPAALRAFRKKIRDGWSFGELSGRLEFYLSARAEYAAACGQAAPLMNGSKFLNQCLDDWDHEWTLEEIAGRWPNQRGEWRWANQRRRKTVDELLAEEAGNG